MVLYVFLKKRSMASTSEGILLIGTVKKYVEQPLKVGSRDNVRKLRFLAC